MKNFYRMLILTISILMLSVPVFAGNDILVQLNGDIVDFTDSNGLKVEPQIINNRTMVPMRKIFEVLGADVKWDGTTKSITANTEELDIGLQINNKMATVKEKNGETKNITLDSAPVIVNNRTLVPVRFIAESLDNKVGWDAKNRAVIIIDGSIIEEKLKSKASNFYSYLNTDFENLETYEMNVEIDCKMKQSNVMSASDIDVEGNMEFALSKNAIKMLLDLEASNQNEKETMEMDIIFDLDSEALYAKSEIIENSEGKWVKYELDEDEKVQLRKLLATTKLQDGNVKENFIDALIPEESLTLDYYKELENAIDILVDIVGNDNFTVSGKTYKFTMDVDDLFKSMGRELTLEEKKKLKDEAIFGIDLELALKDKVVNNAELTFLFGEKYEKYEESLELKAKVNLESYNKNVNIIIPTGSDVVNEKDIRKKSSAVLQAMFSGFSSDIDFLEESVRVAMLKSRGDEAINGNSRTKAQLYNFIARGGYNTVTTEQDWVSKEEAEKIPCTLIESKYAKDVLGEDLPNRKVETANGTVQMSYYVTPKGNVFCWPPYEFDGKSYVSSNVTVKDRDGKELAGFKATEAKEVIIYFKDTSEVMIVKNSTETTFEKGTMADYVYNTNNYSNDNYLITNYYSFCSEMLSLDNNIGLNYRKGNYENAVKKTPAQIYNYLARGADLVIKTEGDWLTEEEAQNLVCTKIDEVYAEYVFDEDVPNMKVDTYQKDDVQASFYITPKGALFCWPPYEYEGKSYVSYNLTVTDEEGNELSDLKATKLSKVILYIESTGEVIIIKNSSKTNFTKGEISDIPSALVTDYNTFVLEMNELEEKVDSSVYLTRGDEAIKGYMRTDEQLYNFIARGGYDVMKDDEDWLIQSDATEIPCTKFNQEKIRLPNIQVDTAKAKDEQVSFFVTPKGEKFCWPPFENEGKSYVNSRVTVKDKSGNEMTVKEATKAKQINIYFETTNETVIVSNESGIKPVEYTKGMENANGIGVWYYKEGAVEGIDFSKYSNII